MVPIDVGVTSRTGFCDRYAMLRTSNVLVLVRSYYISHSYGGVAYAYAYLDASDSNANFGSRLAFRGDIIVEDDVQTFRSIPITNLPISPVSP